MALSQNQAVFLVAYAECGMVAKASAIAGVTRQTIWTWRKNPEFENAFERARDAAITELEDKAQELATGVKPDPRVLMFLLERLKPQTYGQRVLIDLDKLTDAQVERLLRLQKIVEGG